MANLLDSLRLSYDAAGSARFAAQLATENLAGARDPGYAKRTSSIAVEITAGRVAGLRPGIPQRVVDLKVVAAKRDQHSVVEFDKLKTSLLETLDDLNGDLDKDESIDKKLIDLARKAATLTSEVGSSISRRTTIDAMKGFVTTVNRFADGISTQRLSAEKGVIASVKSIEELSKRLFSLNSQLSQISTSAEGLDLSTLDNEREKIVESMAQLMNIQVVYADNSIYVYTPSGMPIVENKVYPIVYNSSGIIDYSAEYPKNINPIHITDDRGIEVDITAQITGGQLGAYLDMRDRVYPSYQKSLDKFVEVFEANVNHIHNQGSGFPPAQALNGKRFVDNVDKDAAISWKADSIVRIAFVNDQGKFVDSDGQFYTDINLNLGGINPLTPSEIRDQINMNLGAGVASFSESDTYGYLNLQAPPGLRIAIGSVDGQPVGETDTGIGFSEYFKLNDLFGSAPDAQGRGYSNTFQLSNRVSTSPSLFSAGKLNSSSTIALTGSVEDITAVASGDGNILSEFRDILTDPNIAFSAAGVMAAQSKSFVEYLSGVVQILNLDTAASIDQRDFSKNVLDGLEQRHSMISGVTADEENAEIVMQHMFYRGVLNTSQHLIDMLREMLDVFGKV
ncbi:FlgK family flagellar hook-associated protein [Candidatus Bodocaedibacter vickermanii]|uniref:Flagellar hook-associated protein 1 n=1 Tax=Candidatus Bodocaedibacter vickermanii TaxID=2741701 RepID=A0A7L9RVQ4_9PROT|nr:flagellar hook-associated protein FlgK [Candidatus Paracaedibacteraceae bacterium 'Lake Konstanz']